MKNYYDQQKELEIAKARLQTLKEQKKMYFEKTQPKSKKIDGEMVTSSKVANNVFLDYVDRTERIDIQIDIIKKEIALLECYLKKMEYNLRRLKGILERVFVARYIDGLSVNQISDKVNYSSVQVYRYLRTIKKIIK
jgi:dihydroorotase